MENGRSKRPSFKGRLSTALVLLLCCIFGVSATRQVEGYGPLNNRSVTIASSLASDSTTYKLRFDITTPGTLGSIQAEFCSNSPIITLPCTVPAGFDISGATLVSQTGETGFSIGPQTTANKLVLTRPPVVDVAQAVSYELSGVVNPSAEGSYYVRIQTFATADASGSNTDVGGLAYDINRNLQISAEVPPYIIFCAGVTIPAYSCNAAQGSLVDLGGLKPTITGDGQSQVLVSTNAQNGYTLYMTGTTLTSGNDTINSLSTPATALMGSNQFGINLRANLTPSVGQDPAGPGTGSPTSDYNQPNKYKFVSGDVIAGSASFEDFRRYTISYIADVNGNQSPGVYVSTVTYVAVGNF